jgi:hypothetical protein
MGWEKFVRAMPYALCDFQCKEGKGMIRFKEGNLRLLKWNRRVFVVASGTMAYKKYFPEYKLEALVMIASKDLLETENKTTALIRSIGEVIGDGE